MIPVPGRKQLPGCRGPQARLSSMWADGNHQIKLKGPLCGLLVTSCLLSLLKPRRGGCSSSRWHFLVPRPHAGLGLPGMFSTRDQLPLPWETSSVSGLEDRKRRHS